MKKHIIWGLGLRYRHQLQYQRVSLILRNGDRIHVQDNVVWEIYFILLHAYHGPWKIIGIMMDGKLKPKK